MKWWCADRRPDISETINYEIAIKSLMHLKMPVRRLEKQNWTTKINKKGSATEWTIPFMRNTGHTEYLFCCWFLRGTHSWNHSSVCLYFIRFQSSGDTENKKAKPRRLRSNKGSNELWIVVLLSLSTEMANERLQYDHFRYGSLYFKLYFVHFFFCQFQYAYASYGSQTGQTV